MITNVRVFPREAPSGGAAALEVRSNFLLARTRGPSPVEILAGERHDVLRRTESGLPRLRVSRLRAPITVCCNEAHIRVSAPHHCADAHHVEGTLR